MNRGIAISIALILADVCVLIWFDAHYSHSVGALFLGVLGATIVSAVVQRLRFGRDKGWAVRLHPIVTLAFIVPFDLLYTMLPMIAAH